MAKYCDNCGHAFEAPEPEPVSKVIDDGEIKYVTVLFADIVGSTEMVADRPPDEAQALLDPVVSVMTEAVEAFGGTVNQRLGDGIMALFGVPFVLEDHAVRACCAALRMHEIVSSNALPTPLRIGIASGQTMLGAVGADVAGSYPAFGATIHLASRLQALARPSTTLCTSSTRALAGSAVEVRALGRRAMRGFPAKQDVFAVVGLSQADLRFSDAVARGLSPLIGRDAEQAELRDKATTVLAGTPVKIAIAGEAGAGKSRLAWEFASCKIADGWCVIQAEAVSYGREIPYKLAGALLRAGFQLAAISDPAQSIQRVQDAAAACGLPVNPAALALLLGVPPGEASASWEALDPFRRRGVLFDTMRTLLTVLSTHQTTLFLIEDLHWADQESLGLLDVLWKIDGRWMLVVTHRSDFVPPFVHPLDSTVNLKPLPPHSVMQLLQTSFPAITKPALQEALVTRSAGNPFFLEELARDALANTQFASGSESDQLAIPSTIQAVVAARIDRLHAEAKQVLVTASVLGNRFLIDTLRGLFSALSMCAFESHVVALRDAAMFRPVQAQDGEVLFSHALIQEVAYTGLPRGRRCSLHAEIYRRIEQDAGGQLTSFAETLTYHASRGELWEELIVVAGAAGRRALGRSAYIEAERFFSQAIDACARVQRTSAVLAAEVELRFQLRLALFPTAGIERSLANSLEAERCARTLGDPHRLGWATAYVAKDLQLIGRPAASLEAAERALGLANGDPALIIASRYFAGQAYYSRGEYRSAVQTLQALIARMEAEDPLAWTGTPGPSVIFYRAWVIWSQARMGEYAAAAATAAEMRDLAREADLPLCHMITLLSEGFALSFAGRLVEAEAVLRESLALCRKWEMFAWSTNISSCLGDVLSRLGQHEDGLILIEQAVDRTRRSGILVSHSNELAWLAEAHRRANRLGQAEQHAREALKFAQSHGERGNEALARLVLGEILAVQGSAEGLHDIEASTVLAAECGMQPLLERGMAHLALATVEPEMPAKQTSPVTVS